MPWEPGQSGNPGGRPSRKPISDAIFRELAAEVRGGGTNADRAAKHLVRLMFSRDPHVALAATKLVLAYVEGLPVQPIDLEVSRAAQRLAAAIGADPEFLIRRAQQLAAENSGAEGTGS